MTFQVPNPGAVVTVVTQYKDPYIGNPTGYKRNRYERVVVLDKDARTTPSEFLIPAENEPYIDKRTINIENVVELVVHSGDTAPAKSDTRFVKVAGSKGNVYTVSVVKGVAKSCDCPGFQFRRNCKHLTEIG